MTFRDIFKTAEKFTIDNSPHILTAIGVSGVITTSVLAARAGYRVGLRQDTARQRKTNKEFAQTYWREFVVPVGIGVTTIASIIGANRVGTRRAAAMAAAYSVSERAFQEYREKVVERLGENKDRDIRDSIAEDRMRDDPVSKKEVIIAGGGDVLCYDTLTGRYFSSDMETIKKAQNDTNYQVLNDYYASLSDFYDRVGLPRTPYSEEVGWNTEHLLEINFSTMMSDDGRPCICLNYVTSPIRNYYRLN